MKYAKPAPGTPILVEIGGQKLEIRFSLKTLKALDTTEKISLFKGELGTAYQDPARMSTILYYGLRDRNPAITQDWVDEHVESSMLLDLAPLLIYATTGKWRDIEAEAGGAAILPNAASPSGTGLPFGQLAESTSAVAKPNSGI